MLRCGLCYCCVLAISGLGKILRKASCVFCFSKYRLKITTEETVMFCLRVMVGVIILYDHVHPVGAFAKSSPIDVSSFAVCQLIILYILWLIRLFCLSASLTVTPWCKKFRNLTSETGLAICLSDRDWSCQPQCTYFQIY